MKVKPANMAKILAALVIVFALAACSLGNSSSDLSVTPVPPVKAVYVARYYYNGTTNDVACYWKDDASGIVDLLATAATDEAKAISVFTSGTDVYASGYYKNSSSNWAPCYWKNGTRIDLYTLGISSGNSVFGGT